MNARFRRRTPEAVRAEEEWTLRKNPFAGSRELSGMMVLVTLVHRR